MHLTAYARAPLLCVVLGSLASCGAESVSGDPQGSDGSSSEGGGGDTGFDTSGSGWEPDTPPDHVTEHLEIWDFGPEDLCAGQIAMMEREAQRLSAEMGLSLQRLRVAWGEAATESLCDAVVRAQGCARGSGANTYIATGRESASHELVHAIRRQNELQTHVFFEEGLAEQLGANRPNGSYSAWLPPSLDEFGPTVLLQYSQSDFYVGHKVPGDFYTLAAHYLTFVRETYGADALTSFLRSAGKSNVDEAFADAFGVSVEASELAWQRDAPSSYELGEPCHEMLEWGPDGIALEQVLSCELEETLLYAGSGLGSTRGCCFDLAEPTSVQISLEVEEGSVTLLADECWEISADSEESGVSVSRLTTPKTLLLAGCRWRVTPVVSTPGGSFRVTVAPVE